MAEGEETSLLPFECPVGSLVSTYCWGFLAGVQANACYVSGCGLTRNGQGKSVVCMVSSMTKISSTWDIHEVSLDDE